MLGTMQQLARQLPAPCFQQQTPHPSPTAHPSPCRPISCGYSHASTSPSSHSVQDVESKYYANGEDAYEMRKYFGGGAKRRGRGGSRGGKDGAAAEAEAGGSKDKAAAAAGAS